MCCRMIFYMLDANNKVQRLASFFFSPSIVYATIRYLQVQTLFKKKNVIVIMYYSDHIRVYQQNT